MNCLIYCWQRNRFVCNDLWGFGASNVNSTLQSPAAMELCASLVASDLQCPELQWFCAAKFGLKTDQIK